MNENMTMAGVGWGKPHREVKIEKVENGFKVTGNFRVEVVNKSNVYVGPDRCNYEIKRREFVYYTVEEVLGFVKGYLSADKEELRE